MNRPRGSRPSSRTKNYRIEIRPRAINDLDAIAAWLASRSPANAQSIIERLITAIDALRKLPLRHPVAPENAGFLFIVRCVSVPPYRVLYAVEKNVVHVLHVRHGARDQATLDDVAPE